MKILLIFNDYHLDVDFVNGISNAKDTEVVIVENGEIALELLSKNQFDLAITAETLSDMTGIELIKKLVKINPVINTAVASNLSKKDFHEATEGLGVLRAIPLKADSDDAISLLNYLGKIESIMSA